MKSKSQKKWKNRAIDLGFNGVLSSEFFVKWKDVKRKRIKYIAMQSFSFFILAYMMYRSLFTETEWYESVTIIFMSIAFFVFNWKMAKIWVDMYDVIEKRRSEYETQT